MNPFMKLYLMLDQSQCTVTSGKRFFAYVIDWFLGSLCTMLPMCLMWMMMTHDLETMSSVNVFILASKFGYTQAYLGGALSIVFALFYYVIVPWKIYPGQTVGKRTMGFKVVKLDGSDVDLKTLIIREILGIMIIEGALYNVSGIIHSMISLMLNLYLVQWLLYIGLAISVVSAFLALKMSSQRMIHDYLAKTKVIEYTDQNAVDQRI
ncbi:RDD family protein [[Eubacterium] hominis]|uniref:RDD family protein n=1 Tax=[Eubacterium] hominis TaxID=2764325 RepID=UPI003A4E0E76